MHRYAPHLFLLMCLAFVACEEEDGPTAPHSESVVAEVADVPAIALWSPDHEFDRLARDVIPGFAGFYQDGERMVALVAGEHDPALAIAYVQGVVRGVYDAPQIVEVERVVFDWAALFEIEMTIMRRFTEDGILNEIDISEKENAVVLGVRPELVGMVAAVLETFDFPRGSVRLQEQYGAVPEADTLDGYTRPLRGGIVVEDYNNDDRACTMGFAAWHGLNAIVATAGHCSGGAGFYNIDTKLAARLYQPTVGTNIVATESADRAPYDCWGTGDSCRRSDATLYTVSSTDTSFWGFGRIAEPDERALGVGPGSDTIMGGNSYFDIKSTSASGIWVGAVVERVGKVNGWTVTEVEALCTHIEPAGMDDVYCTTRVDHRFGGGNSGGPYFQLLESILNHPTDVAPVGIHLAGSHPLDSNQDGWYSRHQGIVEDLGAFTTCSTLIC